MIQPISFKRHRFPAEVMRYAVWLYFRFTLSVRDVEELLAQRRIVDSRDAGFREMPQLDRCGSQGLTSLGGSDAGRGQADAGDGLRVFVHNPVADFLHQNHGACQIFRAGRERLYW